MKSIIIFSCVFFAVFIGQTLGRSPPHPTPCGSSNGLEGYKGACDESVPVIVLPKGRPIMERVLDWLKCCTSSCTPTEPPSTTGTSYPPVTATLPPYPTGTAPPPTPTVPTGTVPPTTDSWTHVSSTGGTYMLNKKTGERVYKY